MSLLLSLRNVTMKDSTHWPSFDLNELVILLLRSLLHGLLKALLLPRRIIDPCHLYLRGRCFGDETEGLTLTYTRHSSPTIPLGVFVTILQHAVDENCDDDGTIDNLLLTNRTCHRVTRQHLRNQSHICPRPGLIVSRALDQTFCSPLDAKHMDQFQRALLRWWPQQGGTVYIFLDTARHRPMLSETQSWAPLHLGLWKCPSRVLYGEPMPFPLLAQLAAVPHSAYDFKQADRERYIAAHYNLNGIALMDRLLTLFVSCMKGNETVCIVCSGDEGRNSLAPLVQKTIEALPSGTHIEVRPQK